MISKKQIYMGLGFMLLITLTGLLIPQRVVIPVVGATNADYHPESFWYHPWGLSGTHKGVDIFADKGTSVVSATHGLVIYSGKMGRGGKVVLVLGPKWRVHYYAHLDSIKASTLTILTKSEVLGTVGNSGNAKGKPAHLHYSISTLLPYPWRIDKTPQGVLKMFYLDPTSYFK